MDYKYKDQIYNQIEYLYKQRSLRQEDLQMQMRHGSLDETDKYLRQMKAINSPTLRNNFPEV